MAFRRLPTTLARHARRASSSTASVRLELRGEDHALSPLWLRLNDPARFTKNGQRCFEIADVVQGVGCTDVLTSECDKAGLRINWADGTHSSFPSEWLERHVKPKGGRAELARHLWTAKLGTLLPEMSFAELQTGSEGLLRVSSYLARYGLAVVRDVPTEPGMVEEVGNQIGHVRTTNYGAIFDVIDLGSSGNNLAQTNQRILAHTDNPYRDPFPGVQMLHCLANATAGGSTTFTDGFAVAEALRRTDADAYTLLSTVSHPFEYRDPTDGVLLRAEVPVLTVDGQGQLQRVTLNNRSAGCLVPEALPAADLERYYAAWAKFDRLANSPEFVLRLPMQPGDLAIFLNSRVMHGRDEYTSGAGRHIQGCYIDHDAVRSRVRWAAESEAASDTAGDASADALGDVHWAAANQMIAALATQADISKHHLRPHADVSPLPRHAPASTSASPHSPLTTPSSHEPQSPAVTQADFSYGEGVNMLEHALQAAHCAALKGEAADAVLACLMHDVGNSPQAREHWQRATGEAPRMLISEVDQSIGYSKHADMGGAYSSALGFAEEVAGAVRLHVSAKRALVGMDASYMKELSRASIDTLAQQGGPMSAEELEEFHAMPGATLALRLRRYDDEGKAPESVVPRLESYRQLVYDHLCRQTALPPAHQ